MIGKNDALILALELVEASKFAQSWLKELAEEGKDEDDIRENAPIVSELLRMQSDWIRSMLTHQLDVDDKLEIIKDRIEEHMKEVEGEKE